MQLSSGTPMPDFPNCETQVAHDSSSKAHNFQFQMYVVGVKKKPGEMADPAVSMMYCTQCGLTYILDPDQQTWRKVTVGEPWQAPK